MHNCEVVHQSLSLSFFFPHHSLYCSHSILQRAYQHINTMKANFGSTELYHALKLIYIRARASSLQTNVFLFTGIPTSLLYKFIIAQSF